MQRAGGWPWWRRLARRRNRRACLATWQAIHSLAALALALELELVLAQGLELFLEIDFYSLTMG